VDGRQRGYTGLLVGDLQTEGNTYALKVIQEGGFYVNGGDPSVPVNLAVPDYNLVLRRILSTLVEAIDREDGVADGNPVSSVDGTNLIDLRPNTGWKDWDQLRDVALGGSQAKLDALKPYLALHAWVDKKVIRPNAVAGMEGEYEGKYYQTWADIKLAHEAYPSLPGTKEPGFERIPMLPTGKLVGRAPVDLAWARTRRPALIALLANLKGIYLDESTAAPIQPPGKGFSPDNIGQCLSAEITLSWASAIDDCRRAAGRILTSTSELGTWAEWDAFCDVFPDTLFTGTTDVRQAKRDILKANFNPNSRLNKFSPNTSLWKSVDKSDLLAYSTEFSLLPQAHAQELESVGRVLGKGGRLLASRVLRVSAAPADRLTLTTQKEFVCESLGDPAVSGDEGALRQPGQAGTPFISRSAGLGGTWGHALGQPGLGTAGASLQTFPEPCVDMGAGLSTRAADYDGSVQLATVETPDDDMYLVAASTKDMKLLARYTDNLDLDVSDAAPAKPPGDPKWKNQPDIQQVTYNGGGSPDLSELGHGILHPSRPNTLYPDGVYSEKDRAPSYFDKGNANGLQGLISFWIKSNHAPPVLTPPPGMCSRGHPFFKWSNYTLGYYEDEIKGASPNQFFYLGDAAGSVIGDAAGNMVDDSQGILCQFEIDHSTDDKTKEHRFKSQSYLTPHRWHLLTMYYDFRCPNPVPAGWAHDCGELLLDAGDAVGEHGSSDLYSFSGNAPLTASDITKPDFFGDHRLVLGKGRPELEYYAVWFYTGSGADATFDELALYDFGGAGPGGVPPASDETLASPGVLAANRFKEGRYYKESAYAGLVALPGANKAGEYFSPPISLGPCRIKALAWTQVVPRGLQAPLLAGGQPGVDGDPGEDARILLELADTSGGDYLKDVAGKPIDGGFSDPASSPVQRTVNAPFRLHAVFQPNVADKDNTPILDPLALDDVTVVYEPLGGRKLLAWREED
jgi:hypothetical protein